MLATQWRLVAIPMGGVLYQGIEYASVETVLSMFDLTPDERREYFAGLRLMESAALMVRNARTDA